MDTGLFLEQFGHLADSPGGVQKLRNLILELAVRGRLVEQRPDDEPIVDSFKHAGLDKVETQDFDENGDELAELPEGWLWKRIGGIAEIRGGKRIPQGHVLLETPTPFIYIRVTDMKNGTISHEGLKYISAETRSIIEKYTISSQDLYITIAGTIGSVGFVPSKFNGMNLTENAAKISILSRDLINDAYMYYALSSQPLQAQFQAKFNQMAQPKLSLRSIRSSFIPLPPLAEQERIVAKVDELMGLCDQLEAEQAKRDSLRDTAAKSTLFHVTSAASKAEAHQYWGYAEGHFAELFDRVGTVGELRAMILQLAVQGRLVAQRPDDEPARELLKRIEAEKRRLVKAGEIGKSSPLPSIGEDEKPYELPDGWEWVRIDTITNHIQTGPFGSNLHQEEYISGGIPVVNPSNLINGKIIPDDSKTVDQATFDRLSNYAIELGDLVMARRGELGRCAIVTEREVGWLCGTGSLVLKASSYIYKPYLSLFFFTDTTRQYLAVESVGATMNNLNQKILLRTPFPLPPSAQMPQIIAKVDELMGLCDQLAGEAEHSHSLAGRLFDSIVYHLFETA